MVSWAGFLGFLGLRPAEGDDPLSPFRVWGEDPMVAVPMHAGRRDEVGQALQKLEGREHQEGGAVGCGPRKTVYEPGIGGGE